MDKKAGTIIILMILVVGGLGLASAQAEITEGYNAQREQDSTQPNFFAKIINYISRMLGGAFSIAGERWDCDALPVSGGIFNDGSSSDRHFAMAPNSAIALSNVNEWCSSGKGLIDTFIEWNPQLETKDEVNFYCPSWASECQVQLYCCDNYDCHDDDDCEDWFDDGYTCESTSEQDPRIDFDWGSWKFCEFTGVDPEHRCWGIKSGKCEEKDPPYKQSYLDNNFGGDCPPSWSYESLSDCKEDEPDDDDECTPGDESCVPSSGIGELRACVNGVWLQGYVPGRCNYRGTCNEDGICEPKHGEDDQSCGDCLGGGCKEPGQSCETSSQCCQIGYEYGQSCDNSVCVPVSVDDDGVLTRKTYTLSQFLSANDAVEAISYICTSNAQCHLIDGYKEVNCKKEDKFQEQMVNIYKGDCQKFASSLSFNMPFVSTIIAKVICGVTSAPVKAIVEVANLGTCVAENPDSQMQEYWEQYLDSLWDLGIPARFVGIAAWLILLIIMGFIYSAIKK